MENTEHSDKLLYEASDIPQIAEISKFLENDKLILEWGCERLLPECFAIVADYFPLFLEWKTQNSSQTEDIGGRDDTLLSRRNLPFLLTWVGWKERAAPEGQIASTDVPLPRFRMSNGVQKVEQRWDVSEPMQDTLHIVKESHRNLKLKPEEKLNMGQMKALFPRRCEYPRLRTPVSLRTFLFTLQEHFAQPKDIWSLAPGMLPLGLLSRTLLFDENWLILRKTPARFEDRGGEHFGFLDLHICFQEGKFRAKLRSSSDKRKRSQTLFTSETFSGLLGQVSSGMREIALRHKAFSFPFPEPPPKVQREKEKEPTQAKTAAILESLKIPFLLDYQASLGEKASKCRLTDDKASAKVQELYSLTLLRSEDVCRGP